MTSLSRPESVYLEVFDRVADRYDQQVPFFRGFAELLVDGAGLAPGQRVLDLGAGRGAIALTALTRVRPGTVLAVDVAPAMAAALSAEAPPGLGVRVMDAHRLDLADATFDVVLSGFVIHILAAPDRALAEAFRVLRPGGTLAISVPGPSDDGGWWARYGEIFARFAAAAPVRPAAPESSAAICDLLVAAGFDNPVVEDHEVHLPLTGPGAYWDWLMSHGARWLYEVLDPSERERFRESVLDALAEAHPTKGRTLDAGMRVYRAHRPLGTL